LSGTVLVSLSMRRREEAPLPPMAKINATVNHRVCKHKKRRRVGVSSPKMSVGMNRPSLYTARSQAAGTEI
jgi:hypothetical protein